LADAARGDVRWEPVPVALPEPGGSRAFDLASRKLLLCNAAGTAYVIENACPHVRVPLEGGAIDGTVLECPHHGGRLDLRDGRPVRLPIRRSAEVFAVRPAAGGGLEVAIPARASFPAPPGPPRT
jgi:3-phenylpropionate/trans-cinnamate dioxygenase ferredoxin component